jgi:hypothetical protein
MSRISKSISEEDVIRKAIHLSGSNAYNDTLSKGVAVTVLQGNTIERIEPDGKRTVVRKITKASKKTTPARIKLK